MCNKLFVVLLVLGLVSNALAAVDGCANNLLVYYTMDNSMAGFQFNSATGTDSIGPIGMAGETFLATNQGYAPGILGNALILSTDGALNPAGFDPNVAAWLTPNEEAGNILDIEPEVESMEPQVKELENKTFSMWIKKTAERDSDLYHPGNDGTEYFLGSYFTYSTYIALRPNADPNVTQSQLAFRAGTTESTAGPAGRSDWITADITTNEWYHVAMVLENTAGAIGYDMRASFYLNGSLLAAVDGLCRAGDAFKWGAPRPWNLAAIGAYQCDENMSTGHLTGGMVDDFGLFSVPLDADTIADIYANGMMGIDLGSIPEPTTIALLGLGGLALLRRKR